MAITSSPAPTSSTTATPQHAPTAHATQAVLLDPRPLSSAPERQRQSPLTISLDNCDAHYSYVAAPTPLYRENGSAVQPLVAKHNGAEERKEEVAGTTQQVVGVRPVISRDSLKKREALLRGKEGSRRRRRWENDRLLHNPYFQPPTPSDWSPVPLPNPHKSNPKIRYELAQIWDHSSFQNNIVLKNAQYAQQKKYQTQQKMQNPDGSAAHGKMPKELRERLKKARGAVGLLRSLEEEVREFILKQQQQQQQDAAMFAPPPPEKLSSREKHDKQFALQEEEEESEQEEILFRPRNCRKKVTSTSLPPPPSPPPIKPLHHACPSDPSAGFTRWLIHSIAKYYGLRSWSVTDRIGVGTERSREVRVAYVGIVESTSRGAVKKVKGEEVSLGGSRGGVQQQGHGISELPRPLWGML